MTKESIEYEKLTQEIYQNLLIEEGLTTEVRHNVKLQGRASLHQVDVYWEYTFGGINHKVAIECKNYNKELSIGKIRDFYAVLVDIGNIQGIMVTKIGYQKGAKEFAEQYGINLIVIREPKADDWSNRIKTIVTNIEAISQVAKKWFVQLDKEWCIKNLPAARLSSIEVILTGINNEIWIYDNHGNKLKNFLQLEEELPYIENCYFDNKHIYNFDNAFIKSKSDGLIKVKCIHISYDTIVDRSQLILDSEQFTKAIHKNILTGEMRFIKK